MEYDIRFCESFKLIIGGGSGCGKTNLAVKILENAESLMVTPPKSICIFYQMHQPIYDNIRAPEGCSIQLFKGVPGDEVIDQIIENQAKPCVVLLDDFGQQLNQTIASLFQVGSRHANLCLSKYKYQ